VAPTWPVAAGSLLLGFAVAQATGIRPLGGLVLVAAAAWCALRWIRRAGAPRAAALVLLYVGAFVVSHVGADTLGAWPAVSLAAAVTGLAAWALADAPASGRDARA
jgi:thiol:disulfide interchange protein